MKTLSRISLLALTCAGYAADDPFTDEDRAWWAIQPLAEITPPDETTGWAKNSIDPFILSELSRENLAPATPASADELVRRIYFDLHGLPPGRAETAAFRSAYEEDPDTAVSRLVDRLLASPRYGERWGQHWLDVVRYAESDGYRGDDYRPDVWRYRDYVVRAFNENKPYDEFIREQLAADEIAPNDPDKAIATAFLRLGIYEWNQRNARMQWDLILTEMTNVTGEAFLGLGIGCAQCHDHKFDPILQRDYFAMQSFLNTTWWPEDEPLASPQARREHERAVAKWEAGTKEARAELEAMKQSKRDAEQRDQVKQFPEDIQAIYAKQPEERNAYEEQLAQLVERQVVNRWRKIKWEKHFESDEKKLARYKTLRAQLDAEKPTALPLAFITTDVGRTPATTTFATRAGKTPVEPAFLTLLDVPNPDITPTETTTGRRSALANWIADKENPFSTRVIVNRIWQRHFGTGLVPTPNDFGRLGEEPSHPELLDWLTRRFLDGDWHIKPLHRLILNSATYRQTARREPTSAESLTDPGNRLLWRFPPQRLDAEQIRDGFLATSGELKHRTGGPSVDGSTPARSIYVKRKRNTPDEIIGGFDAPSGFSSTPDRHATTTPNQSLLLVNGARAVERSVAFAKDILTEAQSDPAEAIRVAYGRALSREPDAEEVDASLRFIESRIVSTEPPPPVPLPYPKENGLRATEVAFPGLSPLLDAENSLWLQPGSRFERLALERVELPDDSVTIEAITRLDNTRGNATVNTLFGKWNGSYDKPGWAIGVTNEKSRYDPRNFILQLVGDDFQDNRIYEVVASNLRFPLQTPVYIAVAVSATARNENETNGSATFYLKDLSDPESPLERETIPHSITGGLDAPAAVRTIIGGREQKNHLWDGQLARLKISEGILTPDQLLINGAKSEAPILDLQFRGSDGERPVANSQWIRSRSEKMPDELDLRLVEAMSDFCHALLSSNEFLYLH